MLWHNILGVPRVTSQLDADTVILRWGETGTPYVVREGDTEAGVEAFIKCVAEGLAAGDLIDGDAELHVAKALLEDAAYLTIFPTTGDVSLTKAGRVLSGSNLAALQAIHDAVGAVISAEVSRRNQQTPDDGDDTEPDEDPDDTMKYLVTKADSDQMYTFGPLYAPNRKDAHGEYTDADTLAKAVHDYVQSCVDSGDNRLNIQHADNKAAGRWVEVCAWPYETTVKMKVPGESEREITLPAGTIYMGIQWDKNVWPDVKKGRLAGLSLGGRAMRVVSGDDPPLMGDKTAAMGEVCDSFIPSENDPSMCANCDMSQDAHDSGDPDA